MTRATGLIIAALVGMFLGSGVTWALLGGRAAAVAPAAAPEARAAPDLLVTLAQTLEAEHRRVDLLISRGEVAAAIGALEEVRALKWPSVAEGGEAAVLLRHDLFGRLLRLRLDYPEVSARPAAELLALCDQGLGAEVVAANAFTARLHALRGEVLEAMGRDDEALVSYEKALEQNRALLQQALAEEGR
jgi:tetratricopeptide (TPR) repeat protein